MSKTIPSLLLAGALSVVVGCGSNGPTNPLGYDTLFVAVEFPDTIETSWSLFYQMGYSLRNGESFSWYHYSSDVFSGRVDLRLPLSDEDGYTFLELTVRRQRPGPEPTVTAVMEHGDGSGQEISLEGGGTSTDHFYRHYFDPITQPSQKQLPVYEEHSIAGVMDTTGMIQPCGEYDWWYLGAFGSAETAPLGSLSTRRVLQIGKRIPLGTSEAVIGMPSVSSVYVGHPLGGKHTVRLDGDELGDDLCLEVEDPPGCFVTCSLEMLPPP